MTDADDRQDGIEGAPTDEMAGLWADVRFWADAILGVFGDLRELVAVGATRSLAVKLCNWLWGVEGAVRRLILAEALTLDASTLSETRPGKKLGATAQTNRPARRRPSFRIFGFIRPGKTGQGPPPAENITAGAGRPQRWHIRFPADPLLSIGERTKRRRAASRRRINPLDRSGAVSRSDPGYVEDIDEAEYQRRLLGLYPSRPGRPSRPPSRPLPVQEKTGCLRSDLSDWQRVEEEWARVIPAPHLAARIFALAGILERRDSAVRRIARLVRNSRERLVDILGQPTPELAWPRHARPIRRCREVEALVPRSQRLLWRLDTS